MRPLLRARGPAALLTSLLVALGLVQPAPGQTPLVPTQGPVTLMADHIEYDTQSGGVVADGHVVATRGSSTITADHLTGNLKTGDVEATGHVTLTQPGRTATGETLRYNYRTMAGEMSQATAKYTPWTVAGRSITTTSGRAGALAASATPCDPKHPAFLVTARRVEIVPDDYLKAYDSVLFVYGVPVFFLPVYTASLKRGRNASSAPTLGYDNFNGVWAEYTQYVPLGDWQSQLRVRFGTRSGLSGEAIVKRHFEGFATTAHLGRSVTFDQNGNQFNLDQYSLDVASDTERIAGVPFTYVAEVQSGHFQEALSGLSASRTEGLFTLTGDTIHASPSMTLSTGGYYRYDAYGTGDLRNIVAASAALTDTLSPTSSTTLAYNFAEVNGKTPFQFDVISPDSAISLSYSYYPGGWFSSGTISGSYDFLGQQTTAGLALTFTASPSLQFSISSLYNLTLQQWSEIDYVLNATCDCLAVGLVYRTFPQTPASNQLFLTLGISTVPGIATTFRMGGSP